MKKNVLTLILVFLALKIFAQITMYPPTLVKPNDAAVKQMPDVFLNWNAVPGVWFYKIQLSTDSLFTSPIKYVCYSTAMNASELSFITKYWWRVKAMGISNDSSDWSSVRTFTTLSTVTITHPVDTGKVLVKFMINWTTISGVSYFDWEVDSSLSFNSPIYRKGVANGTLSGTYTKQLNFGQTYYLRMRARHSKDTSAWCSPLVVTTVDIVKLRRPNNTYDTLRMPDMTASWDWIGSSYYDIAIAYDSALTGAQIYSVDSSSILTTNVDTAVYAKPMIFLFDTVYYWSVRARNASDTSVWAASRSFRTVKTVTLSNPTSNEVGVATLPKFQWLAITGINKFMLQYSLNSGFSTYTQKTINGDSVYFQSTHEFQIGTDYYWRMRAISSADSSVWSPVWKFTISAAGIQSTEFNGGNISLYPIPCKGKLTIDIKTNSDDRITVSLLNLIGQTIQTQVVLAKSGNNTINMNVDKLSNGLYLLKFQNANDTYTRKVIIDK